MLRVLIELVGLLFLFIELSAKQKSKERLQNYFIILIASTLIKYEGIVVKGGGPWELLADPIRSPVLMNVALVLKAVQELSEAD